MNKKGASVPAWADIGASQHIGNRKSQQDSFLHAWLPTVSARDADAGRLLLAVADGMGGHAAGDVASRLVINALASTAKDNPRAASQEILRRGLEAASAALFERGAADERLKSMGSTLTAVIIEREKDAFAYHMVTVGDSPLWHWRAKNKTMERANLDQSLAGALERDVAAGRVSPSEAENDPRRYQSNVLTSALLAASEGEYEIDSTDDPRPISSEDTLLLASDGIETLSEVDISETLKKGIKRQKPASQITDYLIEQVLAKKEDDQDNATILIARPGIKSSTGGFFGLFG